LTTQKKTKIKYYGASIPQVGCNIFETRFNPPRSWRQCIFIPSL